MNFERSVTLSSQFVWNVDSTLLLCLGLFVVIGIAVLIHETKVFCTKIVFALVGVGLVVVLGFAIRDSGKNNAERIARDMKENAELSRITDGINNPDVKAVNILFTDKYTKVPAVELEIKGCTDTAWFRYQEPAVKGKFWLGIDGIAEMGLNQTQWFSADDLPKFVAQFCGEKDQYYTK